MAAGLGPLQRLVVSLPTFLLAIILHEVAHGYVAYRLGDDTAKRAGRLTLSPLAHLDPMGTAMFVISNWLGFGFGWAKPVPVSPWLLRNPRRDRALLTIAGPGANLLQAVAWSLLLRAVALLPGSSLAYALAIFCWYGLEINLVLMVFNLLPIPPLDGSHVAAWLLGVRDLSIVDRLAPVGFVVLMLLVTTGAFGSVIGVVIVPLAKLLAP
jgi:Zn-dependent protease